MRDVVVQSCGRAMRSAQRLDDVSPPSMTASSVMPLVGAAIVFRDDAVLRHVDQTTREVAGVGGLERRVGEALAGAVGRVEVLENGEAFA